MKNHWSVNKLDRGLGDHAADWDALLLRLFRPNPMLDSRFVDALLGHFGTGTEHLCVLRSGDQIEAMCILVPQSKGGWESFLPSQAQVGAVLLDRTDATTALLRKLPGINARIDFLCNDPDFGDLTRSNPKTMTHVRHAHTMRISLEGAFGAYWSNRSKKLVQNMGRYKRRREADGISTRFVCVTAAPEIAAAVDRYGALESQGWKGKAGTAVSADNAQGAFYTDVAQRFASAKQAIVFELWFDDHLAAARIATVSGKTMVMLKTTYDENLDKYSPGRTLMQMAIDHAFKTYPDGVIEFYTNANIDQLAWATEARWIGHVTTYRSAPAATLVPFVKALRTRLHVSSPEAVAESAADGKVVSIDLFHRSEELPADVLALFSQGEARSVELGPTWFGNIVATVYPHDPGVRFFVLRHAAQPVVVMAVRSVSSTWGTTVESLGNFYTALYAPALAEGLRAQHLIPLIKAINSTWAPVKNFMLSPMDPQSQEFCLLREAFQMEGMVPLPYLCFGNWYSNIKTDWAHYLASRPGAARSSIKRHGKRFAADGGTIELVDGRSDMEKVIEAYERVYSVSWKTMEPYPNFMPGLIRASASRGWLRMGIAWLDGKPIAAQVWLVNGDTAEIYKLAYDQSFKRYAPGTLLTARLMEQVIDQDKVKYVDYLIGDDPYKITWVESRRERWGLAVYDPRTIGGLLSLVREMGAALLKFFLAFVRIGLHGVRKRSVKASD